VDDESWVLDGLKLTLRRHFDVITEMTPLVALKRLEGLPAVVAVISDMRMPAMDGATFLNHVARQRPDVVRILLTGEAGPDHGIDRGDTSIFSVLSKPCTPTQLIATLNELVGRQGKGSRS